MSIKDSARKLSFRMGFSAERRHELSDLLYDDTALVVSKQHVNSFVRDATSREYCLMLDAYAMRVSQRYFRDECFPMPSHFIRVPEEHKVIFQVNGGRKIISVDNPEIYAAVHEGQQVKLSYREVFERTFNYVPPNFDKKLPIAEEKLSPVVKCIMAGNHILYDTRKSVLRFIVSK